MKLFVFLLFSFIITAFSYSGKLCYSTGDPHFKTYNGYTPDLYGVTGDTILSRTKDLRFSVLTRIRFGKYWENRGLNSAVSVYMDENVLEHYGSYWKLNNEKNGKKTINNVEFFTGNGHQSLKSKKTGAFVEYRWYSTGTSEDRYTSFHFSVYVDIPDSFRGKMHGLCGTGDGDLTADKKNWEKWTKENKKTKLIKAILPTQDNNNLFGKEYIPHPTDHAFHKIEWENEEQRQKAHKFCYEKLKLRKNLYKDCVFDIKVSGGEKDVAKGYASAAKDIKHAEKMNKADGYKKIYGMLVAFKDRLIAEKKKLKQKLSHKRVEKKSKLKISQENIKLFTSSIVKENKNIFKIKDDFKKNKNQYKKYKMKINDELKLIRTLIAKVGKNLIKKKK